MDYEIDFLPVGETHGDAICIRYWTPNGKFSVAVIDGGYGEVGDTVIAHLAEHYGSNRINYLVLTHADNDHAAGLIPIMETCTVELLYMNLPWLYVEEIQDLYHRNYTRQGLIDDLREAHPYLVQLLEIAASRGTQVLPVFQDTVIGPMTVLAPSRARYISLIPELRGPDAVRSRPMQMIVDIFRDGASNLADRYIENWATETLSDNPQPPTSHSNETSVVQIAQFDSFRALFTGDVGPIGLAEAAVRAHALGIPRQPNLFQIPHQGSRHNVTPLSLDLWLGQRFPAQGVGHRGYATCSVGTNKPSHPRKKVTNAVLRRGYITQEARADALRFSNFQRPGWNPIGRSIPFHTDSREEDDE